MLKRLSGVVFPHIIAVLVFLIVAVVYCRPVFQDKVLYQEDVLQWQGMAQNSYQYKTTHGHFPLWSNGMFSGMPAYQIILDNPQEAGIIGVVYNVLTLWLKKPVSFFFLACVCFYFLTRILRMNTYVGIIGSLAYAYATYNPVIVAAGHDTKMQAIALLPAFIGSLMLICEKKYWQGLALSTLFTAMMAATGHMQIVYYAFIIVFFMFLGYAVPWIRQKDFRRLWKSAVLIFIATFIGLLNIAVLIFTTYDSSKETTRGGSELSSTQSNYTSNGLSDNAAFDFSMYRTEPFVMLVPDIFGGSTELELTRENSKAIQALEHMPPSVAAQVKDGLHFYWGGVGTLVSGPPYAGAIICFLALIGLFILGGKHKWWILAASLLAIIMSWGGYFESFNSWLLRLLPMYNKFRAPSMIIVIPTFLLCMLASLSLQKILDEGNTQAFWKKYRKGLFLTAGIFALLIFFYKSFDYTSAQDRLLLRETTASSARLGEYAGTVLSALRTDRQNLFLDSLTRSFLFIAAAALVIGIGVRIKSSRSRPALVLGTLGVLSFADVMGMDLKYLNEDNYQEKKEYQENFLATHADSLILRDKGYYRVLDLREGDSSTLSYGAMTAYFHHSIGGYHAAKLKIYEDLIDRQLYNFPNCMPSVNMLNTKYFIWPAPAGNPGRDSISLNAGSLGAAWFVNAVRFEQGPQAVMNALTHFSPKDTAILFDTDRSRVMAGVQQEAAPSQGIAGVRQVVDRPDAMGNPGQIRLVKNDNDEIVYQTESRTPRFAVFSEIFYDRGWRAYIDYSSQESPIIRTDYVLRGLSVPAGRHNIRFTFHPQAYYLGRQLQWMANIILLALIAAGVIITLQERNIRLPYLRWQRLLFTIFTAKK
jgi:hypothetical protein